MIKKEKILLYLIFLVFLFVVYLIATSKSAIINDNGNVNSKNVPLAEQKSQDKFNNFSAKELENIYKKEISKILHDYLVMLDSNEEINIEDVATIKERILDLKLPTEFKNLHLNLVLALTKMEHYLEDGDNQKKIESQQLINEAKINFQWLNNYDSDINKQEQ